MFTGGFDFFLCYVCCSSLPAAVPAQLDCKDVLWLLTRFAIDYTLSLDWVIVVWDVPVVAFRETSSDDRFKFVNWSRS